MCLDGLLEEALSAIVVLSVIGVVCWLKDFVIPLRIPDIIRDKLLCPLFGGVFYIEVDHIVTYNDTS